MTVGRPVCPTSRHLLDREVAEVRLPHERWSEAITAVAVPKPGVTIDAAALPQKLRDHLDGFTIPKDVIVVDELPTTSTGKIQKYRLHDRAVDALGPTELAARRLLDFGSG